MDRPEIVIGLVGALGTDLEAVSDVLELVLKEVGYACRHLRLSQFLNQYPDPAPFDKAQLQEKVPEEDRLNAYMNAGNALRGEKGMKRGEALALLSAIAIRDLRRQESTTDVNGTVRPLYNHAFVLRSLKHPDEVKFLREIYGPTFFLVSAYADSAYRLEHLAKRISSSRNRFQTEGVKGAAMQLLERDEEETDDPFGQKVRETFWRGDAYIDTTDRAKMEVALRRIIQLFFGYPFHTPTRDEYCMFCAHAAAFRSASMGRQVGAVIATKDGSILSTGTNEVPKAGGGQYWSDDDKDARDHIEGYDSSDTMRRELMGNVLERLQKGGWLSDDKAGTINDLVEELLYAENSIMKGSEFNALTEFQRPVHAEMSAITDAARRGIAVQGASMYSTAFPCHGCARHIVTSGIDRAVYIEPYPKSLARTLHSDSITTEGACQDGKVAFEPFIGMAPRRYLDCFAMSKRKDNRGATLKWEPLRATPRIGGWRHILSVTNEEDAYFDWREYEDKRRDAQTLLSIENDDEYENKRPDAQTL